MGNNILILDNDLRFDRAPTKFYDGGFTNVFADLDDKTTVFSTIGKPKYFKLASKIGKFYLKYVDWPLGKFLLDRKNNFDFIYREFLNSFGDLNYCKFILANTEISEKRGLYLVKVDDEIVLLGRCLNNFRIRFNAGYGKISPRNCYLDGQRTNCRINNLILKSLNTFELYIFPLNDASEIVDLEIRLIRKYHPLWNVRI